MALRKGQTFRLNGLTWRVIHVSPSRAHCVARTPKTVTMTDRRGNTRTFTGHVTKDMDISPNTDIVTLEALCG